MVIYLSLKEQCGGEGVRVLKNMYYNQQDAMHFALCAMRDLEIGGSFNGRTPDSDSANRGSTPRPPAIE